MFFSLAVRTMAYSGVMAARAMKEHELVEKQKAAPISSTAAMRYNKTLTSVIDWGR